MRLDRLCWDARGGTYVAMTDMGAFAVPAEPGGWARRQAFIGGVPQCQGNFMTPEVLTLLGVVSARPRFAPAPKLGGCNCIHRR